MKNKMKAEMLKVLKEVVTNLNHQVGIMTANSERDMCPLGLSRALKSHIAGINQEIDALESLINKLQEPIKG